MKRRKIRFHNFDQMLEDVQRLARVSSVVMLGKWSLGQIFQHLAIALEGSIDGVAGSASWGRRVGARVLLPVFIRFGLPAGVRLKKEVEGRVFPGEIPLADALAVLERAVERVKTERMGAEHPVFGKLSQQQWVRIHLRHAELHLSFAIVDESLATI